MVSPLFARTKVKKVILEIHKRHSADMRLKTVDVIIRNRRGKSLSTDLNLKPGTRHQLISTKLQLRDE